MDCPPLRPLVLLALWLCALGTPAQSTRIYIAPDDHTDYFWTADEAAYRTAFVQMLDYYLDLADATAGEPPEHQSRWNCDGSFWMWTYEQERTPAQFARLIQRIADGHVSVPLNALCVTLGGAPAEAILRGMYYPGRIEREYGVSFPLAYMMENQTLPYGVVSLWAGAGAKYSWKGVCGCDTQTPDLDDRDHEIYWAQGPDGARVLMKWHSLLDTNRLPGGYAEARDPDASIDFVLGNAQFAARYPYPAIGIFGQGWDDLQTMDDVFVQTAKARTTVQRLVRVSNQIDFFEDFEATSSAGLPVAGGSFGNEWDLYCAAMAEVSARVKRAVEQLRAAEGLALLAGLQQPAFMDGRQAARELAWMDLGLFWEHDWGMVGSGVAERAARAAWQRRLADEIEAYVETLHEDAAATLAGMIMLTGDRPQYYVFNPLGWTRTDYADLPTSAATPTHVVDLTTQAEVPSQEVTVDGRVYLRILAPDLPPLGYKVFEARPGAGAAFADAATVVGGVIENSRYRITVAGRGAIVSLIDKLHGNRELAGVLGGRAINDLGTGSGVLSVENAGPVTVTLRADATGPLLHTTRVTLLRDGERIELRNDIEQNFDATQTWGFSFALTAPDTHHEEAGAVLRARLLADGGHYAPRNARYDWLTLNHFADMSEAAAGITLSNADCYFMKLGNSGPATLDTATPGLSVLAGGRVVNGNNGLSAQGGDTHFLQRFALRAHGGYDAPSAMRFALEHQNPPVARRIVGGAPYPSPSYSALTVSDPNVLLWAAKPADSGAEREAVLRFWNLSDADSGGNVAWQGGRIVQAQRTTHIETPIEPAALEDGALLAPIAARQIQTFQLDIEPNLAADRRNLWLR